MQWPKFTQPSPNKDYNFTYRAGDVRPVRVLIVIGLLFMAAFLWVFFQPENRGYSWLFGLLAVSVLFRILRLLHEWYHYWNVVPPMRPAATRSWTVDILTTYCPGEPHEMVVNTLEAIGRITYPHTTYLCDEANDPYLKQVCADLGVIHVTRTDKTDAKAGNINNALRQATGEICLVIDPDHVPVTDFLDHVLPHFENSEVGFVQCVQGYYNRKESVVAFGAAEQTYSFYGPMMTCMGGYGTAQAIGANCTFRRSALDSIGGHANGLSEDMHTAMKLHAKGWQSVYVPLPLSYGLVPATLSAYYKQQLKWSRGTFELLVTTLPKVFSGLTWRQKIHYTTLPLYYLLGTVQLIDLLIPILSLTTMLLPLQLDLLKFATVYVPLLLTGFLIRQYAQRWLIERHEAGFHLVGGILASGTWWVYVLGLLYTIFRVRVPYIPTPKDDRPRNHFWLILPNLLVVLATLGAISYSIYWYGRFALYNIYFQMMLGFGVLNILILTLNILTGQQQTLAQIADWLTKPSDHSEQIGSLRRVAWIIRYGLYNWLQRRAVALFVGMVVAALGFFIFTYRIRTDVLPTDLRFANTQPFYIGLSDSLPRQLALPSSITPISPYHLTWSMTPNSAISFPLRPKADQLPLLYIELDETIYTTETQIAEFLKSILRGERDAALREWTQKIRKQNRPVLASFMPEFDNPTQQNTLKQATSLDLYRRAWQYIVRFCRQQGDEPDVTWVWCPTQPSTVVSYYPGEHYIDWIGIAVVNDPTLAIDGKDHSFAALFQLPHTAVRMHPAYSIRQKPVLITRLESVTDHTPHRQWTIEALELMQERYPTVRGIVFSNDADLQAVPVTYLTQQQTVQR
ncbi:glycosyltransferase [Fibrisoma montanum]|uniref:Glycosyltransferase n=1 Tax=Fibrisoma montanum TaxID=2305895 RepID=A0A418LW30_9BACT|nr:glycosyltransferase family 2 protein [Fibrisoma montanum]RIV17440.1 glycosyltransferase [Fibrisoma montanum]